MLTKNVCSPGYLGKKYRIQIATCGHPIHRGSAPSDGTQCQARFLSIDLRPVGPNSSG